MEIQRFEVTMIGAVRSSLVKLENAPLQGDEGAPEVFLELIPQAEPGLLGMVPGDELIILTWLHQANRDTLQIHPRGNPKNPLTGVFGTRSPHRPNPIGLHRVTLLAIEGRRLKVAPMEAIDGTPILDIKPVTGDIGRR